MKYETRDREDGECEVWRSIPGSDFPAQHIATFHNYPPDSIVIDASIRIAKINANHFVEEQNHREKLLKEVMDKYTRIGE